LGAAWAAREVTEVVERELVWMAKQLMDSAEAGPVYVGLNERLQQWMGGVEELV
jgi:hypothetical protein